MFDSRQSSYVVPTRKILNPGATLITRSHLREKEGARISVHVLVLVLTRADKTYSFTIYYYFSTIDRNKLFFQELSEPIQSTLHAQTYSAELVVS